MEKWLVTGANGFLGSRLMKFYQGKYEKQEHITGIWISRMRQRRQNS